MSKKNLPHIALYIGDWERDCNVLSLETEMAWMKIIFKMHLSGKEGIYKTSAKSLQILWKTSPEKVKEIIAELEVNQICQITIQPDGYEFICRRMEKEKQVSKTRSDAAKQRYNKDQKETTTESKTSAKVLQNTDNDIDNDIDNDNDFEGKEGSGEKPAVIMPYPSAEFAKQWQLWKNYRQKQHRQNYLTPESEQAALAKLNTLAQGMQTTAIAILHQSMGIEIAAKHLTASTFLPGLELGANTIYIDYTKLKYPGDILHEAGHIAVTHPQQRRYIGTSQMPPKWPDMGDEIAAILWSFAAAKYLEIPVETVFHPHGYKSCSNWYIDNFTSKNYIGLPLLQWMGIAYTNEEVANGNSPFPAVKNWMRM